MNSSKKIFYKIIFPAILAVYPLAMAAQGADLSDTTYSLGNYLFYEEMTGNWRYATFLANLLGKGLILLTGGRMLWMNLLIGLLLSLIACGMYFYLQRAQEGAFVFAGEIIALGLCWCPVAILYNYLSYFLLTAALLLLLTGLEKEKPWLLFPAGALLGVNVFVRVPNLTQMALILVVWYDAFLKKRKIWKATGICIAGYALGLGAGLLLMVSGGGSSGYLEMMDWLYSLLSSDQDAGGYSLSAMLLTILDNYLGNMKWLGLMAVLVFAGTGMFAVFRNRFTLLKKIGFCAGILLLFVYFERNGMYSLQYCNVGSIWGPAVVSVLLSMGICIWELFQKDAAMQLRRLALANVILLWILPLGSNNHIYSVINYLFLAVPVTVSAAMHLLQKLRKTPASFPVMSMLVAFGALLLIQTSLFHAKYVFRDGTEGQERDTVLLADTPMRGMHTNASHAAAMEELYQFMESEEPGGRLLLYGNLPGLCYYLERPSAISTSWPDLDSYAAEDFSAELEGLKEGTSGAVIILSAEAAQEILTVEAVESPEEQLKTAEEVSGSEPEDQKKQILSGFIRSEGYVTVFENEEFFVLKK